MPSNNKSTAPAATIPQDLPCIVHQPPLNKTLVAVAADTFVDTFVLRLRNCRLPELAPINVMRYGGWTALS